MNCNENQQKEEIYRRALIVENVYKQRMSIEKTAKSFGMKTREVYIVLKKLGYWHGINRMEEPIGNYIPVMGESLNDIAFLLKYQESAFEID